MNRLIIKFPNTSPRVKCQIFSRVVGYLRPTAQWNEGKQAEFKDRKTFVTKFNKEDLI